MSDVLLLNFSYEPLGVIDVKRAVQLLFARKVEVVEAEAGLVRSTSTAFPLPSILRMLYYVGRKRKRIELTKKNVLLRDRYTCAYCEARGARGDRTMTVDHVLPKSKGGPSTWENLVCACMRCNNRKNNRSPEHAGMKLKRKPKAPKYIPWIRVKRNTLPGEWHQFLFLYNVSIEEKIESV